ncbi:MAG: pyridoxal-phosphate dependent enzyme [Deltaproteobacteria bacterium]|nr:MAG: pyridoxal-phosphate dependent enzyme [Deltaproteobacteria bacterium]
MTAAMPPAPSLPIGETTLDLVGNTPLVRLRGLEAEVDGTVEIWGKLEYMNPGGSVKDRPARQMLRDALDSGALQPGGSIIDSTSGNTGVAYAMLGAALGVGVTLVMPSNVSQARKDIVEAYGATIIYSDPMEGSDGAIRLAKEIVDRETGRYFYPDQYANPSNPRAHELTTGPEIWRDTRGRVTHFVAGLGTTGTIMGTGRALRRLNPAIRIVAVEPDQAFHGLEGLKHLDSSIVPAIYDPSGHDEGLRISTEDGWDMAERLAAEEGLAVGYSSGANAYGALQVARTLSHGVIVCILCDHADRYIAPRRLGGSR